MTPYVRPAGPSDLEALVRLRLENGHIHSLLDPDVYRVPDVEEVRAHFARRLAEDDPPSALFVAVVGDAVLGSVEVAIDAEPPAHQVLQPVPSVAGIQAGNQPALRFYGERGYQDNAVIRVRDLPQDRR